MYRIRDMPTSAKSKRPPPIQKICEESPWNDNVQTPNLGTYNSKVDKHCSGFFNIRILYQKKRAKEINSLRAKKTSYKGSRSSSANRKQEISPDQIEILKDELKITWEKFGIPEQHQRIFNFHMANLTKLQSATKIAREIDNIEKEKGNITAVIHTIASREANLAELIQKTKMHHGPNVNKFIKPIELLRDITLQCIECIKIWKNEFSTEEDYIYSEQSYFEKLKFDTNFLAESKLSRYFKFYRADPLFTGPTAPKVVNKKEFSIPFEYKQSTRVTYAIEILGFKAEKPVKLPFSGPLSESAFSANEQIHLDMSQIFTTEIQNNSLENQKEISEVARGLFEEFIDCEVLVKLEVFVTESLSEIISASLTLYSSSVLDRVITEVLDEVIPAIAKQSHTEVTDSEYIDIRNLIAKEVMEEEIQYIASKETRFILSEIVSEYVIGDLELFQIALETMDEEKTENLSIVAIVADILIEEFFNEEWVEEIAEVELVQGKMENVWKDLPPHIQKEIFLPQKAIILERVYEMVYFGILNEFVGSLWLDGLVNSVCAEEKGLSELADEEIFVLKDPNAVIEEPKKFVYFRARKF